MVLEEYRDRFRPHVDRIARPFLGWSPDRLTWTALLLAGLAGVVAATVRWTSPLLFLPVCLLIFGSGVFDVIDGAVARRTGRTSVRGDLLDHVIDRYADFVVVVGITLSGFAIPWLGLLALATLLLTSYMGTQAQAVGQGRLYGGLLSRADRLIVLSLAAFLEFDWSLPWPWAVSEPWARFHLGGIAFTVIDVAFLYIVIAGQWTAFARARATYRALTPSG